MLRGNDEVGTSSAAVVHPVAAYGSIRHCRKSLWLQGKTRLLSRFTVADVAKKAGVHRDTVRRWESDKKIPKAHRDRNNARYWTEDEVVKILAFRDSERAA